MSLKLGHLRMFNNMLSADENGLVLLIYIYTEYKLVLQFLLHAKTARHIWPPPKLFEPVAHYEWLPAVFPRDSVFFRGDHADSLSRKPLFAYISLGRKKEIADSLSGGHT